MWGNSTIFHMGKSIKKKYREKINVGENYCLRKVNIDKINSEKVFDRSTDHK